MWSNYFARAGNQNNIDNLRALAIVSVFLHHGHHVLGSRSPFFDANGSWFGVQLFFLISGYLISASYCKHSLTAYFTHRFLRIVPAYLLFFLVIGLIQKKISVASIGNHPFDFLANVLLLQHLFPSALYRFNVLHVSWTLTVEMLWYLLLPILLLVGRPNIDWRVAVLSCVVSTAWVVLAYNDVFDPLYQGIEADRNVDIKFFTFNHFAAQLCFFVFGAWIYFNQSVVARVSLLYALIGALTLLIAVTLFLRIHPSFLTGIAIGFLFVFALKCPPFKNRFVFLISECSYSIYLCHYPIMVWVKYRLAMDGALGLFVSLVITVAVSWCVNILVERPCMKFGRSFGAKESA